MISVIADVENSDSRSSIYAKGSHEDMLKILDLVKLQNRKVSIIDLEDDEYTKDTPITDLYGILRTKIM